MPAKHQKPRVAIYARVSTLDKGQDPQNQLAVLRDYCRHRGFKVVGEFVDQASGRSENRSEYQKLLTTARRRQVDVVLVWRYDRFARSLSTLVNALAEFQAQGVDFISHQEQVDTTTPQGKLFFQMVSGFAEFESSIISERVTINSGRLKNAQLRFGPPGLLTTRPAPLLRRSHSIGA